MCWRPVNEGMAGLLPDAVQIAGHSSPDGHISLELEAAGFYMVDQSALGRWWTPDPECYRYAVIEGGEVRVEGGRLLPESAA